jgi:hypothetical protein
VAPFAGRKTWKGNELHGLKDPKPSSSPRTVFEVYPVRELENEVERGEREILERLEAEGGYPGGVDPRARDEAAGGRGAQTRVSGQKNGAR